MKNVLIISYHFPPSEAIGSRRPYGLYRYLPRNGWQPYVITIGESDNNCITERVVRTQYLDISQVIKKKLGYAPNRTLSSQIGVTAKEDNEYAYAWKQRIYTMFRNIITFPDDRHISWLCDCRNAADALFDEQKFQAIISTSPPITPHLVAHHLKRQHPSVPWIADLRDLWSQNAYYPFGRLRRVMDFLLEKRILGFANAITTVSSPWVEQEKRLGFRAPIEAILNGYDPDDYATIPIQPVTGKLIITYTGTVYPRYRDPAPLFAVVGELANKNLINRSLLEIRLYGTGCTNEQIRQDVSRNGIKDMVVLHEAIPREQAIIKQKESSLLLLLDWNDGNQLGVYSGKLYEYLGASRPILAVGGSPKGVVAQLLNETQSGTHAADKEQLAQVLLAYYTQQICTGSVPYYGRPETIAKYSQMEMAHRFAVLLNRC